MSEYIKLFLVFRVPGQMGIGFALNANAKRNCFAIPYTSAVCTGIGSVAIYQWRDTHCKRQILYVAPHRHVHNDLFHLARRPQYMICSLPSGWPTRTQQQSFYLVHRLDCHSRVEESAMQWENMRLSAQYTLSPTDL